MRDTYSDRINELLVEIFQSVLTVEENSLKDVLLDLSITEMHTLEAVGKTEEDGRTVSALAQQLNVTLPTVTVAIKKLEQKGYVEKVRSQTDGRVVRIHLTRKGKRVDAVHSYFHQQMVRSLLKEVDDDARPVLLHALENLHGFLGRQIEKSKNKEGKQS